MSCGGALPPVPVISRCEPGARSSAAAEPSSCVAPSASSSAVPATSAGRVRFLVMARSETPVPKRRPSGG